MIKGNLFFTSDWHFFHEGIIKICNRKFTTTSKMHTSIIKNINDNVKKKDTLIVAGDIMTKGSDYLLPLSKKLDQIKCKNIILVVGNHDKLQVNQYLDAGFISVHTLLEIPEYNLTVVHDPAVAIIDKNRLFVCGHVHNLFVTCNNCVNVGVDAHDFKPVSIDKIIGLSPIVIVEKKFNDFSCKNCCYWKTAISSDYELSDVGYCPLLSKTLNMYNNSFTFLEETLKVPSNFKCSLYKKRIFNER